jgi:hypothetical protein
MVFKGRGVQKDEATAAQWMIRAANRGNPVAQNRAARLYAFGRGVAIDPLEAAKWHMLARNRGANDPWLDGYVGSLPAEQRRAAEAAATEWRPQLIEP